MRETLEAVYEKLLSDGIPADECRQYCADLACDGDPTSNARLDAFEFRNRFLLACGNPDFAKKMNIQVGHC